MKKLLTVILAILCFPLVALAQALDSALPGPTPDDLTKFAGLVLDAFKDKNYGYLLALGIIALVWGLKKYGAKIPKIGPALSTFMNSDPGGVLTVFLATFGVALAAVTAQGGVTITTALVGSTAKTAFYAMGGYVALKKLVMPLISWVLAKLGFGEKGAEAANAVAVESNKISADARVSDQAAADALTKALDRK